MKIGPPLDSTLLNSSNLVLCCQSLLVYNFLGTFSSKDFEFAPIIAKDDLRESHSKMYCQITESYNIVQRYAIWEISHQKIKPTQQIENGRRWRDGLGREAPQATAANHPFPASDPIRPSVPSTETFQSVL